MSHGASAKLLYAHGLNQHMRTVVEMCHTLGHSKNRCGCEPYTQIKIPVWCSVHAQATPDTTHSEYLR